MMANEGNFPRARLLGMLEECLSEADRLDLPIVAARLSEIVEDFREHIVST